MDRFLRILHDGVWVAVFALALGVGWAAADDDTSLGPALTGPAQILERLPATNDSASGSLVELPLAEMIQPASQAKPSATTSQSALTPCPSPETGEGSGGKNADPKSSPLTRLDANKDRSTQLELVAQQADRQTRHGVELAGRGAHFAARSEFVAALRLVAEGLDTEQKTSIHSRALAAALVAMKEAEDFLPGRAKLEANLDVSGLVAIHTTPVLKNNSADVTPLVALRCYLTFAQEQFARAAGREVAGSMALYTMGKLHSTLAQKKGTTVVAAESKAMVFYQAALLVHPKNHLAVNDLGVLLAQCGRYADGRTMLEYSLSLCPRSTGWRNLATVYRHLGQTALADRAAAWATQLGQEETARRQMTSTVGNDDVRWVDPQMFAQNSPKQNNLPPGATSLPPVRAAGPPVESGRAAPAGRPLSVTNRPTPSARATPEPRGPAPTPAAAQRMSWEASRYQR